MCEVPNEVKHEQVMQGLDVSMLIDFQNKTGKVGERMIIFTNAPELNQNNEPVISYSSRKIISEGGVVVKEGVTLGREAEVKEGTFTISEVEALTGKPFANLNPFMCSVVIVDEGLEGTGTNAISFIHGLLIEPNPLDNQDNNES